MENTILNNQNNPRFTLARMLVLAAILLLGAGHTKQANVHAQISAHAHLYPALPFSDSPFLRDGTDFPFPRSRFHRETAAGEPHRGPIPPIAAGYGSWGDKIAAPPESFQIESQGYTNTVTLYYPAGQTAPAPTILVAPGWNIPCEDYGQLLRFLVSQGYVAVCDDYGEDSGLIGAQLRASFSEAVSRYPTRIDTAQIGLIGHSSGAGLLPSLAYDFVHNRGWGGVNGQNTFIFSAAPRFDFDLTDAMLDSYPTNIKLIMQAYEDDFSTDLRTYIDIFESLPISDTEKDYLTLRTTTVSTYTYQADHPVIASGDATGYGVFDALDDYGVFRLVDALAKYTFYEDLTAKNVALGDGIQTQIEMGALRDLISTDDPRPVPGVTYDYPCDVADNPRRDHCADYDDELPAAVLITPTKHITIIPPSPLFRWESVITANRYFLQVRPLLPDGEPDWTTSYGENVTSEAAGCISGTQICTYQLSVELPVGQYVWWIKAYSDTREGVWSRRGYFRRDHAAAVFLPLVIKSADHASVNR